MFRNATEQRVAQLRYVEGKTQEDIAATIGVTQGRVSQICRTLAECLRQINIDPNNPALTSQAVQVILRRAARSAA